MWEDLLTKKRKLPEDLEDVLIKNNMNIQDTLINEVKAFGLEVRMTNSHNRRAIEPDDGEKKIVSYFFISHLVCKNDAFTSTIHLQDHNLKCK